MITLHRRCFIDEEAYNEYENSIYIDKTSTNNSPINTYELDELLNGVESLVDIIQLNKPKYIGEKMGHGKYAK